MSVIPLTVFFSLLLAGLFIALFAREQQRRRFASAERDSLLPLADETAQPVPSSARASAVAKPMAGKPRGLNRRGAQARDHHEKHAHPAETTPCGCRDGSRPPCEGCVKRSASAGLSPRLS